MKIEILLINTVFFGLQFEGLLSEFGLFGHREYFRLHRALIKHPSECLNDEKLIKSSHPILFTIVTALATSAKKCSYKQKDEAMSTLQDKKT